jgi:hypothetical protein
MHKVTPSLTPDAWRDRVVSVVRIDANGCWNWPQRLMPNGYGRISVGNERHYIHRVAYATAIGSIRDGLEIDHLCRNRACCNPAHLEPVTHRVNNLRSENFAGKRSRQLRCESGHLFDDANTYIAPNGTRKCRACRTVVRRESYARVKARKLSTA